MKDGVLDAVVIGAGITGIYAARRLQQDGLSFRGFEAGDTGGGTWYWNCYPGARCDAPSLSYSYSFSSELEQNWMWSEVFSAQPEILEYLNHVLNRFDLRGYFTFNARVTEARYLERESVWEIATDTGETVQARFVISAVGCLSKPTFPEIEGRAEFKGRVFHTALWPHESVSFIGRRVAVIGVGSSGIQLTTALAPEVEDLIIFQRTPNYSVPCENFKTDQAYFNFEKARYAERRRLQWLHPSAVAEPVATTSIFDCTDEERMAAFEAAWVKGGVNFTRVFADQMRSLEANAFASDFARDKIRSIVKDPETAAKLTPDYPLGSKRICTDSGYFDIFNRSNVTLVDLRESSIQRISSNSIVTADAEYEVDDIIFATGFVAMTGSIVALNLTGRNGVRIADAWKDGPHTYLGMMTHGFPNLFTLVGPGSPSVLATMTLDAEQQMDWVASLLAWMKENDYESAEADSEAQASWDKHVNEVAEGMMYVTTKNWFNGGNIRGEAGSFMPYCGGFSRYVEKCNEVAADRYEGFSFEGSVS